MKPDVTPAFPTLIGSYRVPDAEGMNEELRALILAAESEYESLGRSNVGGWHSRPDFFSRTEPAVAALVGWVTWTVKHMVEASAGAGAFEGSVSLSGWATICRAGAYHAPRAFASRQRLVRRVLRGCGRERARSTSERRAGISRSAWRRGRGERAGRPVRDAVPRAAGIRAARGLPQLALSLGSPVRRANPPYCSLFQRRGGRADLTSQPDRTRGFLIQLGRARREQTDLLQPASSRRTFRRLGTASDIRRRSPLRIQIFANGRLSPTRGYTYWQ